MKNDIIKLSIVARIETYTRGYYSVSDCLETINKLIQNETWLIPETDKRIKKQNQYYKFALDSLRKAIVKMDKMN